MFQKSIWWLYTFKWGVQHNQSILLDACPLISKWKGTSYFKRRKKISQFSIIHFLLQIQVNIWHLRSSWGRENIKIPVRSFTDKHKQEVGKMLRLKIQIYTLEWTKAFDDRSLESIAPLTMFLVGRHLQKHIHQL